MIVAAAGNIGNEGGNDCKQNPIYNPLTPNDPRDWAGVTTVVTPAWFSDYVLTVGAVDATRCAAGQQHGRALGVDRGAGHRHRELVAAR